jgi:hypothetical protein
MFRIRTIIIALLISASLQAQHTPSSAMNRAEYYGDPIHFGFYLGVNRTNFVITTVNDWRSVAGDTLKSILSIPHTGFNLGIVSELRIHEFATLRFVPDIAFGTRELQYHFAGVDTFDVKKKIESTFLDFPLNIKISSKRMNNFAAYMIGGGKFVMDLASQKDVNNSGVSSAQQVVKIAKNDWAYEAGAGVDFFLPYFKFGVELKVSMGLKNLLIRDSTVYAMTLDRLRSQVFLISFTFEG